MIYCAPVQTGVLNDQNSPTAAKWTPLSSIREQEEIPNTIV